MDDRDDYDQDIRDVEARIETILERIEADLGRFLTDEEREMINTFGCGIACRVEDLEELTPPEAYHLMRVFLNRLLLGV